MLRRQRLLAALWSHTAPQTASCTRYGAILRCARCSGGLAESGAGARVGGESGPRLDEVALLAAQLRVHLRSAVGVPDHHRLPRLAGQVVVAPVPQRRHDGAKVLPGGREPVLVALAAAGLAV